MRLRTLGKVGEFCTEASVPIITARGEQVIGFRQLEYVVKKAGLLGSKVLAANGWVYLTNRRILMLDDGWVPQEGGKVKRYHEVPFEETVTVRHKEADRVFVDLRTPEGAFTIAYTPYGAAARLFDWLRKERDQREAREEGELVSPYAKDKWYRHPPK